MPWQGSTQRCCACVVLPTGSLPAMPAPPRAWPYHLLLAALRPAGFGAAYGTAKSGVGIASMGVMRPELVMKVRAAAGFQSDERTVDQTARCRVCSVNSSPALAAEAGCLWCHLKGSCQPGSTRT